MTPIEPERLPRGRHGLSREAVAEDQRRRIMAAMTDVMAEQGYAATSVAAVIARAGVSRETFYQQFRSKLDCFLEAFDTAAKTLLGPLRTAVDAAPPMMDNTGTGPADRLDRFDALLGAYLDGLAAEPALTRVFLVEVFAAGPEAIARRVAYQAIVAAAVADLLGATNERGRFACQALVAAVGALVTAPLVENDLDALRALREPIVDLAARQLLA
jgi:AcrR family transcriptional regulator